MSLINLKKIEDKKLKVIKIDWKYNIWYDENNLLFSKNFDSVRKWDFWFEISNWDEKMLLEYWLIPYAKDYWMFFIFDKVLWFTLRNYLKQDWTLLLEDSVTDATHFFWWYALIEDWEECNTYIIIDLNWKQVLEEEFNDYSLNETNNDVINLDYPFYLKKDWEKYLFDAKNKRLIEEWKWDI